MPEIIAGDIIILRMGGAYEVTHIKDSVLYSYELKFDVKDVSEIYRKNSKIDLYERIYPNVENHKKTI